VALALAAAALLLGACYSQAAPAANQTTAPVKASAAQFPPARSLVPYVATGDIGCSWTIHDPKEQWIRGTIGQGDDDPVINFVDQTFHDWSDSEDHQIEVSAGDPARRVSVSGWASNAGGQTPGSIGFYMDSGMRRLIGGAASVQIWKGGKPVYHAVLAGTPTAAQLNACVRPPSNPDETDEE
jgi:hypothetical protein